MKSLSQKRKKKKEEYPKQFFKKPNCLSLLWSHRVCNFKTRNLKSILIVASNNKKESDNERSQSVHILSSSVTRFTNGSPHRDASPSRKSVSQLARGGCGSAEKRDDRERWWRNVIYTSLMNYWRARNRLKSIDVKSTFRANGLLFNSRSRYSAGTVSTYR